MPTSWFILGTLALCFAFPGPASAQWAETIDQAMRSGLMPATAISASRQSTLVSGAADCTDISSTLGVLPFERLAGEGSDKDVSWAGVPKGKPEPSGRTSALPGTTGKSSATPPKLVQKSAFSVEPDYLPSWVTNQPLAYLRYGAAPAVVTLHFGHK
jgi:hypothetical protein